jgi:Uma2 family endonuclease
MGVTTTLVTVQGFLKLPEVEGERHELINGEVNSIPSGKAPHEVVKKNLNKILVLWLAQKSPAEVFVETMYEVNDQNALIPDLSVLLPGRIVPGSKEWIQGAPELAIEVVSSEPAARVFDIDGGAKLIGNDTPLLDPALSGFSIPTSAIFEGV